MSWTRLVVIEFDNEQDVRVSEQISDISEIRKHFAASTQDTTWNRRLYLIEIAGGQEQDEHRLPPPTAPSDVRRPIQGIQGLATLFSEQLGMPDHVFSDHIAIGTQFGYHEEVKVPVLPSSLRPQESFMLEYFETRSFTPTGVVDGSDESLLLTCTLTRRDIQCHEWKTGEMLLIITRKCSFWSRQVEETSGWDAVILCDTPPTFGSVNGQLRHLTPSRPFNGGIDIITSRPTPSASLPPTTAHPTTTPRPSHSSMHADLAFYFQHHHALLGDLSTPSAAALFATKVVAANFALLLGFVSHQTASMRSRGWSLRRDTAAEVDESRQVEQQWSRFRCSEYLEALAANLDALGLPREPHPQPPPAPHASPPPAPPWTDGAVAADLQHLYGELTLRRQDYDRITGSIAALVGMREARRSLAATQAATRFALVLTPFAWLASVFSMAPTFLPGGDLAWVYWVVSAAAVAAVFAVYHGIGGLWRPLRPVERVRRWTGRGGGMARDMKTTAEVWTEPP